MSSDNKFVRSLIENAKQGNNAAIEQLFQMNLGKIYAFALRLTANKTLAETITKQTFIEAWKKMNLVRTDASFLKWLSAITVYQTIDTLRSKKQKTKIDHSELKELESKDELDKHILELPDQERMIFVLNKIEGYTIEEISDLMGIKKDQVKNHLELAIQKLVESEPSLSNEAVMIANISKVVPELQPSNEVRDGIFSYIMDEKIREQKEQEYIAAALAETEKQEKSEEEIFPEAKEEIAQKEIDRSKKNFKINVEILKKAGYTILGIIIIIVLYNFLTSSGGGWETIQFTGKPLLDNTIMKNGDFFDDQNSIKTDSTSSVTVSIPDMGRLLIDNSTIVSRTKNKNEISLEKGQIRKFEGDAASVFTVLTPLAKFTELYKGGAFRLKIEASGTCKLTVESGWVIVNIKEFDSYVPKNFGCLITRGKYAIPYPSDSSPELISLLENFSGINDVSIGTILSLVTKKESLSLWHLLQLVSSENRFIVFDKLNELVPAPGTVTKEGIQALNKSMLLDWRQEIELKMD
ncbi:MAG: sigma-70 family RNA polymerase sigma factor [Ignavibacterium sp.]|nr:sigma-70 family RNA polymerase sigma factor [Ignavibacterium sp.]